jgi:hypothetical protein
MKHKRVWTEEQKKAVGDRLKAGRLAKKANVILPDAQGDVQVMDHPAQRVVAPEVQAVIDTMTPERKAKLQAIQARQWQADAQTDKATREALERHEALKNGNTPLESQASVVEPQPKPTTVTPVEPPKPPVVLEVPFKVPFRLTGSSSGLMISELSPCLCGEARLKWHPVCLRVKVHG